MGHQKMKIAIVGTRGIPNHYGGFEQFAEQVSVRWAEMGHQVIVYNSHRHPFQKNEYKGVKIVHCYDPEHWMGTAGQFIYDLNCIIDARKRGLDIFLQLGYTSSSIWSFLMPKKSKIITNMDGLEWMRSKYNPKVQKFLKRAEQWAVKGSDGLISDSIGIQNYLAEKYQVSSTFIAYGADVINDVGVELLKKYRLKVRSYHLVIARLEPENSIEVILQGFNESDCEYPLVVVGNYKTSYGEYLTAKFSANDRIHFVGGIYDTELINELRAHCNIYFHGHTVGGTNPSLVEAMGSGAFICAHDNVFNQSVLLDNALYFKNVNDVKQLLMSEISESTRKRYISSNKRRVEIEYNWGKISKDYLALFQRCL